jgi:hypothetical protein
VQAETPTEQQLELLVETMNTFALQMPPAQRRAMLAGEAAPRAAAAAAAPVAAVPAAAASRPS